MSIIDYLFSWRKLDISRDDLVLDVGCGGNPNIRADCCVDRNLYGREERAEPLYIDRPFVLGDLRNLPFRDKAFDYIICKHVIEHVDDIEAAFRELSRVSHKGYIETPNWIAEAVLGWPFHKWVVDIDSDSGKLLVRRNSTHNEQLTSFFHRLLACDKRFRKVLERNMDLFTTSYEWHGAIEYAIMSEETTLASNSGLSVCRQLTHSRSFSESVVGKNTISRVRRWGKIGLRWLFLGIYGHRRIQLMDLLACPKCKGQLEQSSRGNYFICMACKCMFPVMNGIPHLVKEKANSEIY